MIEEIQKSFSRTFDEGYKVGYKKAKEAIKEIREMCWGYDIPSPCCPEYREHHEQMQKIIGLCDSWLKKLEEGEA